MNQPPLLSALNWRAFSVHIGLAMGLMIFSQPSRAESPTLQDAWLQQQAQPPAGYAFLRRRADVEPQQQLAQELRAELEIVARQAAEQGNLPWAHALARWEKQVAAFERTRELARTPGRADLTELVATPRHNPALASLASYGACEPPSWVEVWHVGGISRVPHRDGLTVPQALEQASIGRAHQQSDTAWQITPLGRLHEVGIAAWNHRKQEVTPGSRIVQRLPTELLDEATHGGLLWIDRHLPRYLATRLPGDACTLHTPSKTRSDR